MTSNLGSLKVGLINFVKYNVFTTFLTVSKYDLGERRKKGSGYKKCGRPSKPLSTRHAINAAKTISRSIFI